MILFVLQIYMRPEGFLYFSYYSYAVEIVSFLRNIVVAIVLLLRMHALASMYNSI